MIPGRSVGLLFNYMKKPDEQSDFENKCRLYMVKDGFDFIRSMAHGDNQESELLVKRQMWALNIMMEYGFKNSQKAEVMS